MSQTAHLVQMFDSTIVRAHVSAAGAKGGQEGHALGRSRGGFSTKIHLKADLDGRPLAFHLTEGQASSSHFGFWLGEGLVWTGFGWVLRARGESAAPQRVGSSVLRWRERFAEAAISDPPASWRFSTP